jgi:glycosyltransferase involved in cell wall biosynthesis
MRVMQSGTIQAFSPALHHRLWRRLPARTRRTALAHATGLLAGRPSDHPVRPGIAIAGEFSRASGLGEGARLMAQAARKSGLDVWTIDLPPPVDQRADITVPASTLPPPGVPLVVHVNGPMLPLALLRLPRAARRQRSIIGYWAWETPTVPADWDPALHCVTEAWVPSRFTATAFEPLMPGRIRTVPPPLGLLPPVPSPLGRAAFGLPEKAVVVLLSFNLASSFARKNPLAAIAAFRAAFGDRTDRILVLKVTHSDHAPADFAELVRHADAPNIRLETRVLPPEDCHALTACADIVLSLHRGEGFGLVMAEAMLLGKPVVATGWSGNLDYMDQSNACLVPFQLVQAEDPRSIYSGLWAEPDVNEAARWLRTLADDHLLRRLIGDRARAALQSKLDAAPLLDALRGLA